MTLDWKDLKPHIPLGPGDPLYVERPGSAAEEIAQRILAGGSPILVGGPAGIGKSTEIARAADLLQQETVACLVQLDRFENMRRLTPDRMCLRIIQKVGYLAQQVLRLPLSASLKSAIEKVNAELQGETAAHDSTPGALLNATLAEVLRLSRQRRVTLLIDGLEKVPQTDDSSELFDALGSIREDVGLVVVIPWHAAFGPRAETVIRIGEHFVAVRAAPVEGEEGKDGREFLCRLLLQRLGLNDENLQPDSTVAAIAPESLEQSRANVASHRELVEDAIRWSGGVPRLFLQLLAGAGFYASRRRSGVWPTAEDLADSRADHVESLGRLFLPGDEAAIRTVVGTSGRELALDRKVRLMAHGILLERVQGGAMRLDLNPLAAAAMDGGPHA